MHPLIPDEYTFHDHRIGTEKERTDFSQIQGSRADDALRRIGLTDVPYSFGVSHPGAITLHTIRGR